MVGSEDGVGGDGILRHLNSALLAVRICLIVFGFFIDCDKLELFVSTSSLLCHCFVYVFQRMLVINSRLPESVSVNLSCPLYIDWVKLLKSFDYLRVSSLWFWKSLFFLSEYFKVRLIKNAVTKTV